MVLVFAESPRGSFKKAAFEAVTYGKKTADLLGTSCVALVLGSNVKNAAELGRFGASKVLHVADAGLDHLDSQTYTDAIAAVAQANGASVVVLSHTSTGKTIAGRLSVKLNAGLVSGANSLPSVAAGFSVQKPVFSGKAIATVAVSSAIKVVSIMGNAIKPEATGADAAVEATTVSIPASRIRVKSVKTQEGIVPLPEAETVVSAGRGMKGPENWGMIEQLAELMGATTACSRPVSDSHWRPHHEHVGQTGIAIRPNLYIAIGISGAIQHLAGVNSSKCIVVINKDPEAPFFKAADYGVQGDLFEIVPRFTEAYKKFKANQH
jgi:electron transfer flavoprotein alpha subunit